MASRDRYNTAEDVLEAIFQDEGLDLDDDFSLSDEEEDEEDIVINENNQSKTMEVDEGHNNNHNSVANNARRAARIVSGPNRTVRGFHWEYYDDFDPFDSDWLPEFTQPSGVLVDTTDFQPVDYFKLFFPDEAFDLIAEETNRYAMQYLDTPVNFPANLRFWA